MTEEQVTIKVRADTSEYSAGMKEAESSNREFRTQAQRTADDVKKSWSKATDGISDGAKDMGKSLQSSKFRQITGKGLASAFKVGITSLVGGVAVAMVKAITEAMGSATALFDTGLAEKQANRMNSAFLKVKTTIGAIISPLYTIATEILTHIANGINSVLEGVLRIAGYIMGLVGAMDVLSRSATDYAEGMEDATAAASAGLAGFDRLTTIDTSGMGDEAQAQRIRDMMSDAAIAGTAVRESISETLNPLGMIGNFFANIGLERQWEGFTTSAISSWGKVSQLGQSVWSDITTWSTDTWTRMETTATDAWETITSTVGNAWGSITTTTGQTFSSLLESASAGTNSFIGTVKTAMDGILAIDLSEIWQSMTFGFVTAWATISGTMTSGLSTIWDRMSNGFTSVWNNILITSGAMFSSVFGPIKDGLTSTFRSISSAMMGAVSTLTDGLVSSLSTIPARMAEIFTSVWDGMTSGFKVVVNGIISMLNTVIGAYNSTIGKMNVDILGHTIGFSAIGEIPMLAQGGIAEPNDPFLAVLGDNRKEREFITPESTMRDVVRSVIEEQGGVRQTIEIPISLDGRAIARATYDYYSRESKRRGTSWL